MSLASASPLPAVQACARPSLPRHGSTAALPATGLSLPIVPPCTARCVLPSFAAPGCHMYDAYHNCFLYRPELQRALIAAAEQAAERRRHGASRDGAPWRCGLGGSSHRADTIHNNSIRGVEPTTERAPCHCALDATQLFASPKDIPSPPLPLSRCELHEVHGALPPRWQCYPWRLCFDTAVDGFSLASLYRQMEVVEAQQSQVKAVAFGLIFVHPSDDATSTVGGGGDESAGGNTSSFVPSASAGGEQEASTGGDAAADALAATSRSSPLTSPATLRSIRAARMYSSMRYGAAHDPKAAAPRPSPPPPPPAPLAVQHHGVIGCFTPEVPCLGRHPANVYYGSTDTFVFRLHQLRAAAAQGAWMAADVARSRDARQRRHEAAQAHQHQQEQERGSWAVSNGSMDGVRRAGEDSITLNSPHTTASSSGLRTEAATSSMFGYASLSAGGGDGAGGVPVPMPSRMMLQQASSAEAPPRKVDKAHVRPPPLLAPEAVPAWALATPAATASHAGPGRSAPEMAAAQSSTSRHARPPHSASAAEARPVPRVVPQAPLLEKYVWCGRGDNKKFTVCNPHFLAIGGGKSGAAVYVDETLQRGTTSRWCETFDAPCLFGARPGQAGDSDNASASFTPCTRADPPVGLGGDGLHGGTAADAATASPATPKAVTPTTPSAVLPHREFAISRVVWFSIVEDKRTLRTMGVPDSAMVDALEADVAAAAPATSQGAHVCSCGRCGFASDAVLDPATAFAHHCDLLTFAAPL